MNITTLSVRSSCLYRVGTSRNLILRFTKALFLTVLLIPPHTTSKLQAQSPKPLNALQLLDLLNGKVEILQARYRTNADLFTQLRQTSLEITNLRVAVASSPNAPQPERYLDSLSSYSNFLQRLIDKSPAAQEMVNVLRDMASDFHAKVTYSKGSRGQPLREVETIINTLRDGKSATSGYEVWYVPRALADYKVEYKRFDNLSTPAIMPLPPGNYLIWATRGNYISERGPLTLGDDGRSKRQYDLPVK